MGERWCVGGGSPPQKQYRVKWTNGKIIWDCHKNLETYSSFQKLLGQEWNLPLPEEGKVYRGKVKKICSWRKGEDGGKLISLPVPSSAPVATRDRIKLARSVVSAGPCADKIVLQIFLQFWGEVGRAMYGCLSPRNYTNAQKQKIPRRIYIPPVIFQKAIHPCFGG